MAQWVLISAHEYVPDRKHLSEIGLWVEMMYRVKTLPTVVYGAYVPLATFLYKRNGVAVNIRLRMVSTVLHSKSRRYDVIDMGMRKGTPRLGKLIMKASKGWNAKAEKGVEMMNLHLYLASLLRTIDIACGEKSYR
ncbi:hypothetical protein MaudCBS49596_007122 [Microsporum audouinii]